MNLSILPITYLCHIKQMDILASPTFQLFYGQSLSWCLMLDLLTNSGPLFVGWPLGLWCPPDTRIVNYLDHQSPYCQLRRQNQLLEISFSNQLKAGFYVASYHIVHWWHLHRYFYWHVISNFLKKRRLLFCDLSSTSPSTFFSWWGYRSILSLVHNWRLNISSFTSSTSDCWCHCSLMQPWWWGGQ